MPSETYTYGSDGGGPDHTRGDPECKACWRGYPTPHECGKPGCLLHSQFLDESWDDVLLEYLGDLCLEP